jgi:hypothetical protein
MSSVDLVVSTLLLATTVFQASEHRVILIAQAAVVTPTATPSYLGVKEESTAPTAATLPPSS